MFLPRSVRAVHPRGTAATLCPTEKVANITLAGNSRWCAAAFMWARLALLLSVAGAEVDAVDFLGPIISLQGCSDLDKHIVCYVVSEPQPPQPPHSVGILAQVGTVCRCLGLGSPLLLAVQVQRCSQRVCTGPSR